MRVAITVLPAPFAKPRLWRCLAAVQLALLKDRRFSHKKVAYVLCAQALTHLCFFFMAKLLKIVISLFSKYVLCGNIM